MATRKVEITITGEGGQYEATIAKITERQNQMVRSAVQGTQQVSSVLVNLQNNILPGLAARFAAAFSVTALIGFAKAAVDSVASLQDLSDQTGIAATNLIALRQAGIATGQGVDDIATSVVRLQRSLVEAREKGAGPAFEALQRLGIQGKSLAEAINDPNRLLEILTEKLGNVTNAAERNAIAMDIAGRSGGRTAATLVDLAANQERYRRSVLLSNEQIKVLDDGLDKLAQRWALVKDATAAAVVEFAKWIGLIERSKSEKFSIEIDAIDAKLRALRDVFAGLSAGNQFSPTVQAALRANIEARQKLLEERAKLEKQLAGETQPAQPVKSLFTGPTDADKKAAQERLQFLEQLKDKLRAAQSQFEGLSDPQQAALTQLSELEEKAKKFNDPAMRNLIETIKLYTLATIEKNQADERQKQIIKDLTDSAKAYDEQKKEELDLLKTEMDLKQKVRDFELEKLRAVDAPQQVILQRQIELLQEQQRALENSPAAKDPGQLLEIKQKIDLAQIQLQKLGEVSINIGQTIAGAVGDAFEGVILGTRKLGDVGKGLFAALLRDVGQFFTQALLKKAGFEGLLLSNVNGFVPQLTSAIGSVAGGGALPGSQVGGGGAGGGMFGGIFGSIGNILGTSTGIGNSTIGSLGAAGLGGFGLSSLLGGSGRQNLFSSIGSIGGSLLGSIPLGTVGIGGSIYSGFSASGIIGDLASSLFGSTIGGAIGDFLLPGIGSLIGLLLGGLFQKIPDPSVWTKTIIKFYYDALTSSFGAFSQATIVKFRDIGNGRAAQVLAEHQKIIDQVSKQFVDLLNAFPTAVHAPIEAALGDANKMLEILLGNKKYSDLGSRTIQQELADLQHHEAPAAMFNSLREAIGIGLRETFKLSGFDFTDIIGRQFGPLLPTLLGRPGGAGFFGGRVDAGLFADTDPDKRNAFFNSLSKLAGFGGTLAGISPRGVAPFLSDADLVRLQGELQRVFESPTEGFATAVDDMIQRLQPLSDFLKNAVTESTNIFSRGMIAALDAATASQAYTAFQQNIGTGIKEKIFSGITEAFVASAQFTDLLAPIQKVIREFTQTALDTGETPDIAAFRRAIFPAIEDISTRAELLRPLIEELQKLGVDVKKLLGLLGLDGGANGDINITINGNVAGEEDAQNFARRIEAILRPSLPPPQ